MAKNVFRKRGFGAHEQEKKRRKQQQEAKRGNIFRFFIKANSGEEDIPIRFLTEEPILFYEHTVPAQGGKYDNIVCTGEDCTYCADGDKPQYKGAWLIIDGRPIEVNEYENGKPTGKKKTIKDTVKIYARGETDIAKLKRKSQKFGLLERPYFVTRVGEGNKTSYELERGDTDELTTKQLRKALSHLPDKYSDYLKDLDDEDLQEGLYEVVEDSIFGDVFESEDDSDDDDEPEEDDDGEDEDIDDGVMGMEDDDDDDDEEDEDDDEPAPVKKPKTKPKPKAGKKKPAKKTPFKKK